MAAPLLQFDNLTLTVAHEGGTRRILDGIAFDVYPGEVMGLVGESGSGKTMTALATMGLLPQSVKVESGRIVFDGVDLLRLSAGGLRAIRGSQIAMIFQNPRAALNPLMRVGDQVARAIRVHRKLPAEQAYTAAVDSMKHVGMPDAATRARAYPHQLSGGMAQRVLIATMLACRPRLLIADEPTTGLDVTIQAQIFELMKSVQLETGAALLLITHDLGVVSEVCQRVAVMYAGQIMEIAPVTELFARPRHPYTERLMSSILRVDQPSDLDTAQALTPTPIRYDVAGCRFANRCPDVHAPCWSTRPQTLQMSEDHRVVCHKYVDYSS